MSYEDLVVAIEVDGVRAKVRRTTHLSPSDQKKQRRKTDPEFVDKERKRSKKWRENNREKWLTSKKKYNTTTRDTVLEAYGRECKCCGETTPEFLAIDHMNGGGAKHRKEIGGGSHTYRWLVKNNFPAGFQILCHNCNMAKGFYGQCPHSRKN